MRKKFIGQVSKKNISIYMQLGGRRLYNEEDVNMFIASIKKNIKLNQLYELLAVTDMFVDDNHLAIYFRKRLFILKEELIKLEKLKTTPYTRNKITMDRYKNELLQKSKSIYPIYIPSGGQNKKY